MLLVLSITFYFHYNIWGGICSTGPFQYRWLKGYIYSSCYYHNQIGSIHLSHCCHIFPWLCIWDVCYISILSLITYTFRENREFVSIMVVQFMMSANNRIRFGLQIVFVCLYITPSHYRQCAVLSEDKLIKCLSDIFVVCVSTIKHILSVIRYAIYGAVCFQFTHFPCDDWDNIYTLSYHQIGSMNYYLLFRVRSWNNGMPCMSFYILVSILWEITLIGMNPLMIGQHRFSYSWTDVDLSSSHHLSQCWPRGIRHMAFLGHNELIISKSLFATRGHSVGRIRRVTVNLNSVILAAI